MTTLHNTNGKKILKKTIEDCFMNKFGAGSIPELKTFDGSEYPINIMVPHAGYVYSGPTAAHAYSKLVKDGYPETFVILCPNHTGYGADVSVYNEGSWVVPNGVCDVDNELADEIIKRGFKMKSLNTLILQRLISMHI